MNVLTYKGYQGRFEYDPDADIFHGEVMNLADVITFQGGPSTISSRPWRIPSRIIWSSVRSRAGSPRSRTSRTLQRRIAPELHQRIAQKGKRRWQEPHHWVAEALDHAVASNHA